MGKKRQDWLWTVFSAGLAFAFISLLLAYVFIWRNAPHLMRMLGLNV
ncbi:MAG TPA: hypothetical protein VEW94_12810 [Chloroflexia bacterium]|nr:hypothetical protein [Chloroflexia bacterium]